MTPLKLIVCGPVGAGKTTLISTLSETPTVNTDYAASEDIGKSTTTVAMDYGEMPLGEYTLRLFGTPGQDRFDFMWEVLAPGALGLLLLVAGNKPSDFPKARSILEFITSRFPIPFLVCVTHHDMPNTWQPEEVANYFQLPPEHVVGINACVAESGTTAITALLELIHTSA